MLKIWEGNSPVNEVSMKMEDGAKAAFNQFRQNLADALWVRLRQQRAAELRQLLSDPNAIDLETFNREVWRLESSSSIDGRDTKFLFSRTLPIPEIELPWLQEALGARTLEFHGNSIWGSATQVYGSMLKESPEQKTAYIHQALLILNSSLAPLEKAVEIIKIKGFGENIATGLVMVFHPTEFALCNGSSKDALHRLGFEIANLESFENSAAELKTILRAADFIELDAFLYRLKDADVNSESTKFWWVNQGSTYEIESAGGYIWAPKTGRDGKTVYSHHRDLALVKSTDVILHYANGSIRAVSQVTAEAADTSRPGELPTNSWQDAGFLVRTDYHELTSPILLTDIPIEWRSPSEQPFTRQGTVKQGYFFSVSRQFVQMLVGMFPRDWPSYMPRGIPVDGIKPVDPLPPDYMEPSFEEIFQRVRGVGFRVTERTLRRYHLSLKTRGFVILSGVSGTGKTWLTKAYADAIGAKYLLVPVAPNWTTNEDLLGYFNPLDNVYHDTSFSLFLRRAAGEYQSAKRESRTPTPFHLVLDEMNLARVEYYFAMFLSTMETRMREGIAPVGLAPNEEVLLPPNLFFVGTVNVDETTHGFANKVYDRAQLLELQVRHADLEEHIGDMPYRALLMQIWSITEPVAPFAYRIVDEIKTYVTEAEQLEIPWSEAFDEQLLQKVLPKLKGTDLRVGATLQQFVNLTEQYFPLSFVKAKEMADGYRQHGFASYF